MNTLIKVNEKPILFNTEMVKAILSGKKTRTSRVIKPPRWADPESEIEIDFDDKPIIICKYTGCFAEIHCLYDADELWVRETWFNNAQWGKPEIHYRADGEFEEKFPRYHQLKDRMKWGPSIFMFREFSRIQLKVKNIKIERIQDISDDDIKAEGIEMELQDISVRYTEKNNGIYGIREKFIELWNSINLKRGYDWGKNPLVWAVEFELLNKSAPYPQ